MSIRERQPKIADHGFDVSTAHPKQGQAPGSPEPPSPRLLRPSLRASLQLDLGQIACPTAAWQPFEAHGHGVATLKHRAHVLRKSPETFAPGSRDSLQDLSKKRASWPPYPAGSDITTAPGRIAASETSRPCGGSTARTRTFDPFPWLIAGSSQLRPS